MLNVEVQKQGGDRPSDRFIAFVWLFVTASSLAHRGLLTEQVKLDWVAVMALLLLPSADEFDWHAGPQRDGRKAMALGRERADISAAHLRTAPKSCSATNLLPQADQFRLQVPGSA
jgi:hypothetical protein